MLLRYILLLLLTVFGMLPSIGFSMIGTPVVATDASGKASGLTYAKARYYNPAIGRFYAPDPIAFRESDLTSINRYAYAANNPYKYVDPTGTEPMFGDPDWDTVNGWGAVNNAYNQVGYGLDTYKGEIAAVAGGVGVASYYGGAILTVAAKETVSEIASEYTAGLSDFLSFAKLGKLAVKRVTDVSAANNINPNSIRFSQSSVNGTADLVASMRKNGFKGDAIDVVRMSDGGLTTLDNTRVLAAGRAGVNVKANIHNAGDAIPTNMAGRFVNRKGQTPSTFGEAVLNRINNQNSGFRKSNPLGSSITGSID